MSGDTESANMKWFRVRVLLPANRPYEFWVHGSSPVDNSIEIDAIHLPLDRPRSGNPHRFSARLIAKSRVFIDRPNSGTLAATAARLIEVTPRTPAILSLKLDLWVPCPFMPEAGQGTGTSPVHIEISLDGSATGNPGGVSCRYRMTGMNDTVTGSLEQAFATQRLRRWNENDTSLNPLLFRNGEIGTVGSDWPQERTRELHLARLGEVTVVEMRLHPNIWPRDGIVVWPLGLAVTGLPSGTDNAALYVRESELFFDRQRGGNDDIPWTWELRVAHPMGLVGTGNMALRALPLGWASDRAKRHAEAVRLVERQEPASAAFVADSVPGAPSDSLVSVYEISQDVSSEVAPDLQRWKIDFLRIEGKPFSVQGAFPGLADVSGKPVSGAIRLMPESGGKAVDGRYTLKLRVSDSRTPSGQRLRVGAIEVDLGDGPIPTPPPSEEDGSAGGELVLTWAWQRESRGQADAATLVEAQASFDLSAGAFSVEAGEAPAGISQPVPLRKPTRLSGSFLLRVGEVYSATGRRALSFSLRRSRAHTTEGELTNRDMDFVILTPEPLLLARMRANVSVGVKDDAIAQRIEGAWRTRKGNVEVTLPAQGIGEDTFKDGSTDATQTGPLAPDLPLFFRYAPPTRLELKREGDGRQGWAVAPWDPWSLLKDPNAPDVGAPLARLRTELLYGLETTITTSGVRLAEATDQLGRLFADELSEADNPAPDLMRSRLALLEPWRPGSPSPRKLDSGVSFRFRPTRVVADPFAPAEAAAGDFAGYEQSLPYEMRGLRGGVDWGFSSRAIWNESRTGASSSGLLENVRISALGASGHLRAGFALDKTTVLADAFLGRTFFYSIERVGRIGALWNRAKYVVVYERTVGGPGKYAGRPVLQKTKEFVQITQPLRSFPDGATVDSRTRAEPGCVLGSQFADEPIEVKGRQGQDIPEGWVLPLYVPEAGRKEPRAALKLSGIAGRGADVVTARILNPERLVFFSSTQAHDSADSDAWAPVPGVDYPLVDVPTRDSGAATGADLEPANDTKKHADPSPECLGHEAFTLRLDTSSLPVDITGGRTNASVAVSLENITIARRSEAALAGGALTNLVAAVSTFIGQQREALAAKEPDLVAVAEAFRAADPKKTARTVFERFQEVAAFPIHSEFLAGLRKRELRGIEVDTAVGVLDLVQRAPLAWRELAQRAQRVHAAYLAEQKDLEKALTAQEQLLRLVISDGLDREAWNGAVVAALDALLGWTAQATARFGAEAPPQLDRWAQVFEQHLVGGPAHRSLLREAGDAAVTLAEVDAFVGRIRSEAADMGRELKGVRDVFNSQLETVEGEVCKRLFLLEQGARWNAEAWTSELVARLKQLPTAAGLAEVEGILGSAARRWEATRKEFFTNDDVWKGAFRLLKDWPSAGEMDAWRDSLSNIRQRLARFPELELTQLRTLYSLPLLRAESAGSLVARALRQELGAEQLRNLGAQSLKLLRAYGRAPALDSLELSRDKLAYFFHETVPGEGVRLLQDALQFTHAVARFDRPRAGIEEKVQDSLRSLSVRLPTAGISRALDAIHVKDLKLADVLPDFAGLKLSSLIENALPPDALRNVALSHGIDPATRRPFAQADVNLRLPSTKLLDAGPLTLMLDGAQLAASTRIALDEHGVPTQLVRGQILADWTFAVAGQWLLRIRNLQLSFEQGRLSVHIDARGVEFPLEFLVDLLSAAAPEGSGLTIEMLTEGGRPAGVRTTLAIALPTLGAGAFSISNLSLQAFVEAALRSGGFQLAAGLSLASRRRPFQLGILFLSGGGWCELGLRDGKPFVDVGLSAGAGVAINLGVVYGAIRLLFDAGMQLSGSQVSVEIGVTIEGEVRVLGIVSVGIYLRAALRISGGNVHVYGVAQIEVKICWFIKIKASAQFKFDLVGKSQPQPALEAAISARAGFQAEALHSVAADTPAPRPKTAADYALRRLRTLGGHGLSGAQS